MIRWTSAPASAMRPGQRRQRPGRLREDRVQRVDVALPLEWQPAGQHLVQHHAEAEHVAAVIDGAPRACSGDM